MSRHRPRGGVSIKKYNSLEFPGALPQSRGRFEHKSGSPRHPESIEALRVISDSKLLFGCDTNFPNTGRIPALADDSEFIVVRAPGLESD